MNVYDVYESVRDLEPCISTFLSKNTPHGFSIAWTDGSWISVQSCWGHYCSNRKYSSRDQVDWMLCEDAEVYGGIMWQGQKFWISDDPLGWVEPEEIISLIRSIDDYVSSRGPIIHEGHAVNMEQIAVSIMEEIL